MRYWLDRGLTGMRLFTFGSTMSEQASWLDDPKSYPAWTYAAERGLSICMQMSAAAIPQLMLMIERFPKVNIILDHAARPVLADGPPYAAAASLFGLARYSNVYLKLTARNFTEAGKGNATPETFFPKLVAEFGAGRLAWARIIRRRKERCPNCWNKRATRSRCCRNTIATGSLPKRRSRFIPRSPTRPETRTAES
jgi:hypothetical protein